MSKHNYEIVLVLILRFLHLFQWFTDYSVIFNEFTTAKLLSSLMIKHTHVLSYKRCHNQMRDPVTNRQIGKFIF